MPATATITPYPQSLFSLLYTSLKAGDTQPALFRVSGDGTGDQEVGPGTTGFSDIAYSPDQKKILFIRTVTYDNDGQSVTAPELFVAEAGNPSGAKQITKFGTSQLSHPSLGTRRPADCGRQQLRRG